MQTLKEFLSPLKGNYIVEQPNKENNKKTTYLELDLFKDFVKGRLCLDTEDAFDINKDFKVCCEEKLVKGETKAVINLTYFDIVVHKVAKIKSDVNRPSSKYK